MLPCAIELHFTMWYWIPHYYTKLGSTQLRRDPVLFAFKFLGVNKYLRCDTEFYLTELNCTALNSITLHWTLRYRVKFVRGK